MRKRDTFCVMHFFKAEGKSTIKMWLDYVKRIVEFTDENFPIQPTFVRKRKASDFSNRF